MNLEAIFNSITHLKRLDMFFTKNLVFGLFSEPSDAEEKSTVLQEDILHLRELLHFSLAQSFSAMQYDGINPRTGRFIFFFFCLTLVYKHTTISLMKEIEKSKILLSLAFSQIENTEGIKNAQNLLTRYIKLLNKSSAIARNILPVEAAGENGFLDNYSAIVFCRHPVFSTENFNNFFGRLMPEIKGIHSHLKSEQKKLKSLRDWGKIKSESYQILLKSIIKDFDSTKNHLSFTKSTLFPEVHSPYFKLSEDNSFGCRSLVYDLLYFFSTNSLTPENEKVEIGDYNRAFNELVASYLLASNIFTSLESLEHFAPLFDGDLRKLLHQRGKSGGIRNVFNIFNRVGDLVDRPERDELANLMVCSIKYVIERDLINGKLQTGESATSVWRLGTEKYFGQAFHDQTFFKNFDWASGEYCNSGIQALASVCASIIYTESNSDELNINFDGNLTSRVFELTKEKTPELIELFRQNPDKLVERYLKYVYSKYEIRDTEEQIQSMKN